MSYSELQVRMLLEIVDAVSTPGSDGRVGYQPEGPLESAAVEGFHTDGLVIIRSRRLNGNLGMTVTAKGFQTAEAIRAQLQPEPPRNPIGFAASGAV